MSDYRLWRGPVAARGSVCIAVVLIAALAAFAGSAAAELRTGQEPIVKDGQTVDPAGLVIENKYVKAVIAANELAGQILHLVYKPTGQDLAPQRDAQGYCTDRMGEDRFFWKTKSDGYHGELLGVVNDSAVASASYTWHYDYDGIQTQIRVSKTYSLPRDSATLFVTWKFENLGKQDASMSPWIKHVGGYAERFLGGSHWMLGKQGGMTPGSEFVRPVANWIARLSGTENSEQSPMVCSLTDFSSVFQQFCWAGHGSDGRFTLETVLNRVAVKAGQSWETTYAIALMPNLGNPAYASPELGAAVRAKGGKLEAGQAAELEMFVAAAMELGEKRLEGEILTLDGELVVKLPNQQIRLSPGKIDSVRYTFTPPAEGAYVLSVTVFDDAQQIVRLGESVNSQRTSITLPLVVGPTPELVIQPWEASGVTWPARQPRQLTPCRTVLNSAAVRVGQVRVPERVFPEDRVVFSTQTRPAQARLAKGEYEALQLVVEVDPTDADVMTLDLSLSPLRHDKGGVTLGQAELREVFYLTTEVPSGYKSSPVGQWPDPLFKLGWHQVLDPQAVAVKRNLDVNRAAGRRVFWVIARADRENPAGMYRGDVRIIRDGKALGAVPLEIRVSDFTLPVRPAFRCSTGMVGFHEKKWESSVRALGLAEQEIHRLAAEKRMLDRAHELLLEYGWTPTMWMGLERFKRYHDHGRGINVFAADADKKTEQWLKEKGLLDYAFTYAPFDEHTNAEVPQVVEWARQWTQDSEIPILDCFYGDRVEPLFGLVDIWLGQNPTQPWARERKKQGDKFFAVNNSLIWYLEHAPIAGRAEVWQDYALGYDGRYVYSTLRWTEDTYRKNWTSGNYMGCAIYPGPTGLATSIRMETLRDAVEDYDYLAILRQRVDRAQGKGNSPAVLEARKILEDKELGKRVQDVDALHELRDQIADLIERL